ncbi:ATP-binding cassette domain-containing protein [Candidatus Burkholderia verschuerenii]|uniref:ATP-binding cassette domain-containing protein n=1 Tax=Candidatus Burkholderia verschuerenii TaxID=242163 RepID=UPI00067D8D7B|nr:ATP-binding cassette domain-containing protein [Candidatus Burkholderia verschuerenii]
MTALLSVEQITKTYPGVKALQEVSFSVEAGTVHAVMGENGAGKSTLMQVIARAPRCSVSESRSIPIRAWAISPSRSSS